MRLLKWRCQYLQWRAYDIGVGGANIFRLRRGYNELPLLAVDFIQGFAQNKGVIDITGKEVMNTVGGIGSLGFPVFAMDFMTAIESLIAFGNSTIGRCFSGPGARAPLDQGPGPIAVQNGAAAAMKRRAAAGGSVRSRPAHLPLFGGIE